MAKPKMHLCKVTHIYLFFTLKMSKDKRSEKLSSYQGMQKKFPLSSPLHIA